MEKTFEVRDMRHKEKFQVDDLYLNGYAKKVGVYGTAVYVSLCRHANKQQEAHPSIKRIAEQHGCSEKQIGRAIKALEDLQIIQRVRMGKKLNNRYLLLDKSEWTGSPVTDKTHSPITTDSQSDHLRTDSPIHSKDTHFKDTHKKDAGSPSFDLFYEAYPKKANRKGAARSWAKVPAAEHPRIFEALEASKRSEQWAKDGGRFVPHPATWLNQERWKDDLPPPPEKKPFFGLMPMRETAKGWQVLEKGQWNAYGGKLSEIEWR